VTSELAADDAHRGNIQVCPRLRTVVFRASARCVIAPLPLQSRRHRVPSRATTSRPRERRQLDHPLTAQRRFAPFKIPDRRVHHEPIWAFRLAGIRRNATSAVDSGPRSGTEYRAK
jgi:hypothetical protein